MNEVYNNHSFRVASGALKPLGPVSFVAPAFVALAPAPGAARSADPETSKEAAKSINITYLEGKVFNEIKAEASFGATQDELVLALNLPSNSVTPRFKPLATKGLIVPDGTRLGNSGRRQTVWRATTNLPYLVKIAESRSAIVRQVEMEQAKEALRREIVTKQLQARTLAQEIQNLSEKYAK